MNSTRKVPYIDFLSIQRDKYETIHKKQRRWSKIHTPLGVPKKSFVDCFFLLENKTFACYGVREIGVSYCVFLAIVVDVFQLRNELL